MVVELGRKPVCIYALVFEGKVQEAELEIVSNMIDHMENSPKRRMMWKNRDGGADNSQN